MKEKIFYRKTYGVRGFLEWELHLPTGYDVMPYISLKFEGGQITGYGVAPALYTTDDPVIQRLIEKSPWFYVKGDKVQKGPISLEKAVRIS